VTSFDGGGGGGCLEVAAASGREETGGGERNRRTIKPVDIATIFNVLLLRTPNYAPSRVCLWRIPLQHTGLRARYRSTGRITLALLQYNSIAARRI